MTDIDPGALAEQVGTIAKRRNLTVAVAESLTGGSLTAALAAASDASQWLRGGLVAYSSDVKHAVLGVRPGPVVSEEAALDLAVGITKLLGGDLGLAVTGVGGPAPQDDQPPGTVWAGVHHAGTTDAHLLQLEGTPEEIVDAAVVAVLQLALDRLR
ncbi:MAG: CinA family protein [Acidimicrobiales bacterium]|nr:CinA family protein [Acidimicrobiales bacterium]